MTSVRTSLVDRLTVGLFVLAICAPLLAKPLAPERTLSRQEKRELARFPGWEWSLATLRRYPARLDLWFRDHFGLRDALIRLYSRWCIQVLRQSPLPRVVLGRDGWLFYNGGALRDGDPISDYRGARLLSPAKLEEWRWKFQDLQDWLSARRIRFLLVFAPGKGHIYPEFLPDGLNRVTDSSPLDQLVGRLRERSSVPCLDLREAVLAAKKQERCYFRTDTHWTDVGAYFAYRAILDACRPAFTNLIPSAQNDFARVEVKASGDLAQMISAQGILEETVPVLTRPAPLARLQSYEAELQDVVSVIDRADLPRALVWRDSMGNALLPMLADHFRHVLFRWYDHGIEDEIIEGEQPQLMILELGDQILRKTVRISSRIRQGAAEQRFQIASHVMLAIGSSQHIQKQGGSAHVELPAFTGADRWLPILRLDITAPGKGEVEIHWKTGAQSAYHEEENRIGARLQPGANTMYMCLTDPEMTGSLRLDLSGPDGNYELRSIEVRGVAR